MKCPACGKRLLSIIYAEGEYICDNDDCPAKTWESGVKPEWYGTTQEEINTMWSPSSVGNRKRT